MPVAGGCALVREWESGGGLLRRKRQCRGSQNDIKGQALLI